MVGDARVHKSGRNMDGQPKTRESASAFKPTGYIIGKGNFFLRNPQDHLAWFNNYGTAVLHMHGLGYILKMRIIFYVIDVGSFLKNPEIVTEGKINRAGSYLRFFKRL